MEGSREVGNGRHECQTNGDRVKMGCCTVWCSSCLLDVEADVEEAVGGVRPAVGAFHLRHEASEALAQLGRRALQDVLAQRHGQS